MVVPIERASVSCKTKKFVGNDQIIDLKENYATVKVIGNNCQVRIEDNSGCLKVIGDCCQISVCGGKGCINYVGNSGKIRLGEGMDEARVTSIGNGVEVTKIAKDGEDNSPRKTSYVKQRTNSRKNCVNLNNMRSLHIGQCQNIFVPRCHNQVCISVPDVESLMREKR
ncbi:hypothetical protein Trydic_g246 [Trypoxylus dichotomus]